MEQIYEIIRKLFIVICYIITLVPIGADTIVLTDGQEIDGTVTGVTDAQVILETPGGNLVLPKSQIDSVFIGPDYRAADSETRRQMLNEQRGNRPNSTPVSDNDGKDQSQHIEDRFSYLWIQGGLADAKDFVRPLINRIRQDSLILQALPYGNAKEDIAGKQFYVDMGWLQMFPNGLFLELRSYSYFLQHKQPQTEVAVDISNPNVATALPGSGTLNFYTYRRLYGQGTLGYQWNASKQFLVEPRVSIGYTNYAVDVDGSFYGFLAATNAAYLAEEEIHLKGGWPSVGMGTKLRYKFDAGASEVFLLMEIHRIAGSIETSVERYSAGSLRGYSNKGFSYHFLGPVIVVELGYIRNISPSIDLLFTMRGMQENMKAQSFHSYSSTPSTYFAATSPSGGSFSSGFSSGPSVPGRLTEESFSLSAGIRYRL